MGPAVAPVACLQPGLITARGGFDLGCTLLATVVVMLKSLAKAHGKDDNAASYAAAASPDEQ